MKKLLIITNSHKDDYQLFVTKGLDYDVEVSLGTFDEITIRTGENDLNILWNGLDLKEFKAVYFRTQIGQPQIAAAISSYGAKNNIQIFDKVHRGKYVESKIYDSTVLKQAGLPVIDSQYLTLAQLKTQNLPYPMIIKDPVGSKGTGVFLAMNFEQAEKIMTEQNKRMIIQPFLENDGDLRVIVIGGKAIGAMKRSRTDPNEYRNNVAQGGSVVAFELTKEIKELAESAARTLNYDVTGVDLIFDSKLQKWVIMEVNLAPQIAGFKQATAIDVEGEIIKFIASQI